MFVVASSGGWIVALVFAVIVVAVAFGLFSRQGGEIDEHPLGGERGDGAPGAAGSSELEGQDAGSSTAFEERGSR